MLIVNNLAKAYKGEPVLNGVSFTVQPGQVLGILGGNGAGKTTLISVIASILPADEGAVSLFNVPISRLREYRSMVGYVPQNIALSPRLSVRRNLEFWAAVRGYHGQELHRAVQQAAVAANVTNFLGKPVGQCSGGMARRANLAAGLVGQPRLILLDEPTAGIDEANRDLMLKSVAGLRDTGCITLMVNHYESELAQVCDRVITLKDGRIAEAKAHVL